MKCRICGNGRFGDVIDLGPMPLVNNLFSDPDQRCDRWPLKVVFCRHCSLAQLTETPPPSAMFDEYLYFSSQSHTMVAHAESLVNQYVSPGQRVFEIASNDGYLLQHAQRCGATALGVDPARNIAAYANGRGIPTLCEYFNQPAAARIVSEWGHADRIFANNVLAHVPDPHEIVAGIATLLAPDGEAHIEVPYLLSMIDAAAFDTIYHEHQCYFSATALQHLVEDHNLHIADISLRPIHGGSLHLVLRHQAARHAVDLIDDEHRLNIKSDSFYSAFATRVEQLKNELSHAIDTFGTVVGYGAAAKGVVLLNTFQLDRSRIAWVADVSPHKQGKYIPGTRQPIVSPDELLRQRPHAALLLPWNIKSEVVRRNAEYLNQGGRFIVPIPQVEIIENAALQYATSL